MATVTFGLTVPVTREDRERLLDVHVANKREWLALKHRPDCGYLGGRGTLTLSNLHRPNDSGNMRFEGHTEIPRFIAQAGGTTA